MADQGLENELEQAFDLIRGWTNGAENPRVLLTDLINRRKIRENGPNYLNLQKAIQHNNRLFYLCPTSKSKMGRKILLEAEVSFQISRIKR